MKVKQTAPTKKVAPPKHDASTHSVSLTTNPAAPKVGRETTVNISVKDAAGAAVTKFADLHTKPMHLIAISEDLSDFQHVHPAVSGQGSFDAKLTFKKDAHYRLWTEVKPQGANKELLQVYDVSTAGAVSSPARLVVDSDKPKIIGDAHATLAGADNLVANKRATLTLALGDHASGRPLDLEPLLGAGGHAIVVSADRGHFSHEHGSVVAANTPAPPAGGHGGHGGHGGGGGGATVRGSNVAFDVTFPAPGRYRVFFQTQARGEVITVPYTVDVR